MTEHQPNKEKSDQPFFKINQKDVYENKIQISNKSKSNIKPSGKTFEVKTEIQ